MYNKRVQIDAEIDIHLALVWLEHFVNHYRDSHVGRNHPVVYGVEHPQPMIIYQTEKSYIIRKG